MSDPATIKNEFEKSGRVWLRNVLTQKEVAAAQNHFPADNLPGSRLEVGSDFQRFLTTSSIAKRINSVWPDYAPVRFVTFDKSSRSNWALPWHQDRVIAVVERHEVDGYTNWSKKNGIWHCEPPVELLKSMLFVRLYLDPVKEENGGMEWALGSHQLGLVPGAQVGEVAQSCETEIEKASAGDVLVLNMLTLHRSVASRGLGRRRVVRIDFSSATLPGELEWAY
ncbi:MAG: phytanoyl-CoA dioxygenase family protein [Rhizobiaceae bacterium]|nr:phytanoyl-CoA dioxygenase family protein [Rhizobiaceae bacterium]